MDFNNDWLFTKGEQDKQVIRANFDDSGWESVRLPHDWAIAGPFDPAGDPAKLFLSPDHTEIVADGYDLSYILVESMDSKGNLCPMANDMVTFKVEGPAEIAGIGNGNPLSMEPFHSPQHSLFHGKAMLILRSLAGKGGTVKVTAKAEGYETAQTRILIKD